MHKPPYRIKNMMPGMIMGWSGSVESIPSGWHICDGLVGTIDLRNKFIVGAGDSYVPGDTGGSDSQTHDYDDGEHYHTIPEGNTLAAGNDYRYYTSTKNVAGTTDAADNRPQFYAFCWIQKL